MFHHLLPLLLLLLVFVLNARRRKRRGGLPDERREASLPEALLRAVAEEDTPARIVGRVIETLGELAEDRPTVRAAPPRPAAPPVTATIRLPSSAVPVTARPTATTAGHRPVKYLLDSDVARPRKTDRVADIQRRMRGKGLCSPR